MCKNNFSHIKSGLILLFLIVFLYSCSEKKEGIKVAVAANFASTINEIADSFKVSYPGCKITIIRGSSGKLTGQILNGADYDIFLSADSLKPALLYKEGFTRNKPVTYALGSLVLFTKTDLKLKPDLSTLLNDSIKHIAIANPKLAPYGKASIEAIKNAGLDIDTSRYVFSENIIQTFQHLNFAADVGFVSKSLVLNNNSAEKYLENKNWVEVDTSLYEGIKQCMILLNNESEEAQQLFNFILSDKGKKIIKKCGYSL